MVSESDTNSECSILLCTFWGIFASCLSEMIPSEDLVSLKDVLETTEKLPSAI
jgi:hypothetical protein